MSILIINNYEKKENQRKVEQIVQALKSLGKDEVEIWVYSEIKEKNISKNIEGIILSGSANSLMEAENLVKYSAEVDLIKQIRLPILGICFGHQLIGIAFGSRMLKLPKFMKTAEIVNSPHLPFPWFRIC